MVAELVWILAGFMALGGSMWWLTLGVKAHLDDSLAELDGKLAEAIQQVLQAGANFSVEPPNPMQQLVMSLIQQRMTGPPRGADGQFIELKEKV